MKINYTNGYPWHGAGNITLRSFGKLRQLLTGQHVRRNPESVLRILEHLVSLVFSRVLVLCGGSPLSIPPTSEREEGRGEGAPPPQDQATLGWMSPPLIGCAHVRAHLYDDPLGEAASMMMLNCR
jgi:hypothetical protein